MVGKMDGLEPEQRTDEAATTIFREVLGHRPGYARGLGEMVIPESSRQRDRDREKEYLALIEKHKQDAENYKSQLDEMRGEIRVLREKHNEMDVLRKRQNEMEKMLQTFFANMPQFTESLERDLVY